MKRFLIVGTQRTGSSVIAESIGLNPKITCGWEWTLRSNRDKKLNIAKRALSGDFSLLKLDDQLHMKEVHNQHKDWIGFRWLFSSSAKWVFHPRYSPALWLDRLEDFIRWTSHQHDIHIMHIVRRDSLEWLKSVYLSKKLKLYSKNTYPDHTRVKINVWEAMRRLQAKNWIDSQLAKLTNTNPYHLINYEDFLYNQTKVLMSALEFIGCNYSPLNISGRILQKQSKRKVSDYIENYADLVSKLSKRDMLVSNFPIG